MSDKSLAVVDVLKITDNGQLAFLSLAFRDAQLKARVASAMRRLLENDTTGIAPVEFMDSGGTDFFIQLLRPLADDRTVDGLLRALANNYDFKMFVSSTTVEAVDAEIQPTIEALLRPPTTPVE